MKEADHIKWRLIGNVVVFSITPGDEEGVLTYFSMCIIGFPSKESVSKTCLFEIEQYRLA